MERLRSRNSNVTALSSSQISSSKLREGNRSVQKHRKISKLASDSSSWSSNNTEDSYKFELEGRSLKQPAAMPMKKLLAEEMSRETESKKRSPSVIARLMGFEGLPSQQPSHRHQRKSSSESLLNRVVLTDKVSRNGSSSSRGSSRKCSKDEGEFKDVFEVLDGSRMETSSYSSRGTTNSRLSETEKTFIQQKFMEAKRLSTDDKLKDQFEEAVNDLDSNKDLLLKFLEQPDSLFTKHMHDLRGVPSQSRCSHIIETKSLYAMEHEPHGIIHKKNREISSKSRRKHQDGLHSQSCAKHSACSQLESGNDMTDPIPTRIVVLKPNLAKLHNNTRAFQSPQSSHYFPADSKKHPDLLAIKKKESVLCEKKSHSDEMGSSKFKSRESKEIAKEVTRQMRRNLSSGSLNVSGSGFRGYAGDESSSNRSDNDSGNDSEVPTVPSRNSSDWSNQYLASSSHSTESSVSREAKKRLSERWKMTHKSVDMGVIGRGSTLGEMLAIPDREVRSSNSNFIIREKGLRDKVDGNDGPATWVEPLGISSRDGWKDVSVSYLSRSRSVPASSSLIGSPKAGGHCGGASQNRHAKSKEVIRWEREKPVKGNFYKGDSSDSRKSRSRIKKSLVPRCAFSDFSDVSPEIHFGQNQVHKDFTAVNPFKQSHMISSTSDSVAVNANSLSDHTVDVTIETMVASNKSSDPNSSNCASVKSDPSNGSINTLQEQQCVKPETDSVSMQHPFAEHESSASSKEADQPSPVSVLETPFPDDLSSGSECFESLSADLHGLRMQLQMLKLESEAYEGPVVISSDDDTEDVIVSKHGRASEENREVCYIVDVLLDSGINEADPDSFIATWHFSECPVNPLVFEELEKKYSSHSSWPRSERKLLFDRINSALLMLYQQSANQQPWVKPAAGISLGWPKNGLEDGLNKLLANQNEKVSKVAAGNVLASEGQWLDLRDDIDVIGRDIERILLEEIVDEVVAM